MIQLIPISLYDKKLLENWLDSELIDEGELRSYKNFSNWFELLIPDKRLGFIVEENKNKIGFIDLEKNLDNVGYFSFFLTKTERNKGKSKKMLLSLIQKSIELNFSSLEARVNRNNIPSQKSLESVGFIFNGVDKDGYLIYFLPINSSKHI